MGGAGLGVQVVAVRLVAGGTSTLTVAGVDALAATDVAAALDEAGDYRLADL